jgi:adenosine deaminase
MRGLPPARRLLPVIAFALLPLASAADADRDAYLDALFARGAESRAMLRLMLQTFPKGADLHRHADGAVYAEDMIEWAAAKDGCLLGASGAHSLGECTEPTQPRLRGLRERDTAAYNAAIASLSMGRHVPYAGDPAVSGHERFFASFGRFSYGVQGERARVLAANREAAGQDRIHYLELGSGPRLPPELGALVPEEPWDEADMAGRFERLEPYLAAAVAAARRTTDEDERLAAELNDCDAEPAPPACNVVLRYLMTVGRGNPDRAQVFASMALAFALVDADPRYVGVNIAAPEDGYVALRDYGLHMRMFAFFRQRYPHVPLTLHAGELTLGLVPPAELTHHIRDAIEIAGARRIGHGVDIVYEHNAVELLRRMARERIAVEINLTSNDVILGIKGRDHPLPIYLAAGVPLVLSSDDPGVSRADLTQEYLRAVDEHGLSYTDLRQLSRNSLTYSFIEGESLWRDGGRAKVKVCDVPLDRPTAACEAFLAANTKAREQWRLERAFAAYEEALPKLLEALPVGDSPAEAAAAVPSRFDTRPDAVFARAASSRAMLRLLLRDFPKGADLHRHGVGSIYVEDAYAWAEQKGACYAVATRSLVPGPCTAPDTLPLDGLAERDTVLYNDLIDSRGVGRHGLDVGDPRRSGHERFFGGSRASFGTSGERDRVVAANRELAALDRIHYLELMEGPLLPRDISGLVPQEPWNEADMAGRLERLQPYLAEYVALARAATTDSERRIDALNGCDAAVRPPACGVTVRYLMSISRREPPELVFAAMARSFALVAADPRYVGVNIAAPEDGYIALRDYRLHMRMFAFFKQRYPDVPLALHAGELALGLQPLRDLTFHIREAVEVAGARRVGHGVDVAHEHGAAELLARMARDGIAVEINLSSNDIILGVKDRDHPLRLYMAAGVPVTLSSDDVGVSRADLTEEYVRAVHEHGLTYSELKQISRNTLVYSFLEPEAKARELKRLDRAFREYEARLTTIARLVPLGN